MPLPPHCLHCHSKENLKKIRYDKKYKIQYYYCVKCWDKMRDNKYHTRNKIYLKEYRSTHREELRQYAEKYNLIYNEKYRQYKRNIRKQVVNHYGGKCACCGEFTPEFLAIDHINGGGRKHQKEAKYGSLSVWIKKNNFPEGFQILCHNCNMGKSLNNGICPHKRV